MILEMDVKGEKEDLTWLINRGKKWRRDIFSRLQRLFQQM